MNYVTLNWMFLAIWVGEMALNFFLAKQINSKIVEDPVELAPEYLWFQFWMDLLSLIPWPVVYPRVTFLRLFKVLKMTEY